MTFPSRFAHLLAVLALLAGTSAVARDNAADVAAIQAVDQAWLKAFNGNEPETLANLYAENAVLLPPGAPGVHGRAAIKAFFTKEAGGAAKDGVVFGLGAKPDGGAHGDLGWASGTYTIKDKAGKVLETGKYLSVSKKKDGKWQYVRDTWNSDGAPPPPATKK
ncbi:MAG: SgcJ/EcaC family oxidoreductase [Pseudomonadota bacterium]